MKIIHLFPNEKFTKPYLKFINKHMNSENHYFWILDMQNNFSSEDSYNFSRTKYTKLSINELFEISLKLINSDKIILHSMLNKKLVITLFFQPWLLSKCYWVIWGADLYSYRNAKISLKDKIYEFMRKKIIKRLGNIVYLVEKDYYFANKWYKTKAKSFPGIYINPIDYNYLDSLPTKSISKCINIQIGNSGDPTNQHIEALHLLEKFSGENIRVFLPLSYGLTESYKKEILSRGYKTFGNKFIPMFDFMKADDYGEFLSSIDIGIFNNNRQQGLGNIYALLYLNKKVFLRSDTSMWNEFVDNMQLSINKVEDIPSLNFENFIKNNTNNKLKIKEVLSDKEIIDKWNKIFYGIN